MPNVTLPNVTLARVELAWLKLIALTAARQRLRHRHYRFAFRPAPGGALGVRLAPRNQQLGREAASLSLRPRTSDRRTFEQVFLDDAYWLGGLARWPELAACCRSASAPLILDLGANIGLASLALHWQLPRAHLVALEPEAANFAALVRHTRGLAAIEPLHAAVGAADGWVRIANPDAATAGFRTAPAAGAEPGAVPCHALNALAARADGFLLVKMDIEGAEHTLFDGDASWLDRCDCLIVEPHDWMLPGSANSAPLLQALAARHGDLIVAGEHLLWLRLD